MKDRNEDEFAELLAEVRADEGHEPSPLFWDHFRARVADAIRHETPEPPVSRWAWLRNPATAWGATASIALLLLVTALWRATLVAPTPQRTAAASVPTAPPAQSAPVAAAADDVEQDEAWSLVRAAADDWRWEDAHAAGISAHPGSTERVVLEMTADERVALAQLLEAEMKMNGAS